MSPKDADRIANSLDPDQTAPRSSDCLPRHVCPKKKTSVIAVHVEFALVPGSGDNTSHRIPIVLLAPFSQYLSHILVNIKLCFQLDEKLRTMSYVYSSFRRKGSIGPMKVYIVKPGTFTDLRAFMIENTTGSPNQYKVPRVLKKREAVQFIMERTVSCLLP